MFPRRRTHPRGPRGRRLSMLAFVVAVSAAPLAVIPPAAAAPPANDDFASPTVLAGSNPTAGPDSNLEATKQVGEPDHAGDPGGASLWYRWTAPGGGAAVVTTAASNFDTTLGVYTGGNVASLTEVAGNDDNPMASDGTSRVVFATTAGTVYRIAIDGYAGETGDAMLEIVYSATPANDDFVDALVLSGTGIGRGSDFTLGASKQGAEPNHAGDVGGSSIWYRWTAPGAGTVVIDTYGSDFDTLLAAYTGSTLASLAEVASNDDDPINGCCTSRITFATTTGTEYRIAVDGLAGSQGAVVFALNYTGDVVPPANDDFADAIVVTDADVSEIATTVGATRETGEPDHAAAFGTASVWFRWTAPSGGAVSVYTTLATYNTVIAVYTGSDVAALSPVAANDDDPVNGGPSSSLEFTATAGTTYAIALDGAGGANGAATLDIHLAPPATAAITWDPSGPRMRVANRPRTCNTPEGTCTDSGKSFTDGTSSMAVSGDGVRHYLHAIWTTNAPTGDEGNGRVDNSTLCATDADPATGSPPYCAGVFYQQSTDAGTSWDGGASGLAPMRLSDPTTHASRGAMAATDEYVYVAYVETVGRAGKMCANDARVLYVRVNTNHGRSSFWWPPVRLSPVGGRVDFPSITAEGSSVHVVATDAADGSIVLYTSQDWGETFTSRQIGSTRSTYDNGVSPGAPTCPGAPTPPSLEGYAGRPTIADGGDVLAASWFSNDNGKIVAKISADDGATWPGGASGSPCDGSGACTVNLARAGGKGAGGRSVVASAGAPGRVAFAWVDDSGSTGPRGLYVRTYLATGGWAPRRLVSCMEDAGPCADAPAALRYNDGYAPAIAMYGTSGLAVAWSACPYTPTVPAVPCDRSADDAGAEVLWKESWNSGATWSAGEGFGTSFRKLAGNLGTDSEVNQNASIAMGMTTGVSSACPQRAASSPVGLPVPGCNRYVLHTGQTLDATTSRLYLKVGSTT